MPASGGRIEVDRLIRHFVGSAFAIIGCSRRDARIVQYSGVYVFVVGMPRFAVILHNPEYVAHVAHNITHSGGGWNLPVIAGSNAGNGLTWRFWGIRHVSPRFRRGGQGWQQW